MLFFEKYEISEDAFDNHSEISSNTIKCEFSDDEMLVRFVPVEIIGQLRQKLSSTDS